MTYSKEEVVKVAGYEFGQFKPDEAFNIQVGNIIYLIGKKGTGKTTALINLLYHTRNIFWGGYAFVGSTTTQEQLSKHLPCKLVKEGFSKQKLEEIYAKISKMVKKYGQQGYDLKKHHFVVILDDVCWDKKILNLPVMRQFHMNCRHIGVTLIVCAQYMMDLGPDKRNQIDYAFFLKNNVPKEIEKIRENYVPIFDKNRKHEFIKIFTALNQTGRMMVVDTAVSNKSAEVDQVIKYFKTARDVPPFTFGSDEFWAAALKIPREWLYPKDHKRKRPTSPERRSKHPYSNSPVKKSSPTLKSSPTQHTSNNSHNPHKNSPTLSIPPMMDNFSYQQLSLAFPSFGGQPAF